MTSSRQHVLGAALFAVAVLALTIASAGAGDRLSLYTYRDTRDLVSLVEDAARLMEQKGEQAFAELAKPDSKWLNDDYYIFVYAVDGTCLFHPVTPELIGKNVIALKDMNGKPIVRQITDIGRKPENDASG